MPHTSKRLLAYCLCAFVSIPSAWATDGIEAGGDLAGGAYLSGFYGISNTGTAVGYSQSAAGFEAVIWTPTGGLVNYGDLAGGIVNAIFYDISRDGSVIVGTGDTAAGAQAMMWTQAGGLVSIGDLPGGIVESSANAVSANGRYIVGYSRSANGIEAYRWSAEDGMVGMGDLAGGTFESTFNGITPDGSMAVGYGKSASGTEAVIWTQSGGMVSIGDLAGGAVFSYATDVSNDGRVVVGVGRPGAQNMAFRWTQADGMTALGDLPGGLTRSSAFAVSGNGEVIVGTSRTGVGDEAFRWTEGDGIIRVEDWLAANGHALTGWQRLVSAEDTNYNGSVVVGYGLNGAGDAEGFIATIGGLVTLTDTAESLSSVRTISQMAGQLGGLALQGSHHRTLYDQGFSEEGKGCLWLNGDAAHFDRADSDTKLVEVGGCMDVLPNLRIGAGVGKSKAKTDLTLAGKATNDGEYAVLEADWKLPNTPFVASATGIVGLWDTNIKRGYINAGAQDFSTGKTKSTNHAIRFRLEARNLVETKAVSLTPFVSHTLSRTHQDGYTETDGGFPANFDDQTTYANESRIGLTATQAIREDTSINLTMEAVHRFDRNSAKSSGEVIGLFDFNQPGEDIQQNWGRLGMDIDHRIDESSVISVSAHAATRGEDPDISGSISYKYSFGGK
ncbi:MAG: autotransporter domain-containing protein [Proteobacteria bacterium]|nr:autotransporter domain-containing protein [Pseudomonadota bacterium]